MSFDPFKDGSFTAEFVGNEWPDDTVIYPDTQVGAFNDDGVVLMTDDEDAPTMWEVAEFSKVDAPERFDKAYGLWVIEQDVRDDALDERSADAPEPQETEVAA
ncbi:hypothetical protein PN419_00155 [Halorubrum ezzemoulense]|uniref:hypothetical protein n=1 Tax=Halorubrum ezzemoulense TaxID=337243 RepID=UPI00232FC238|nr:hypothetical protein [Halorubrum ezzemoulense]MDB9247419.1 hypothetical protein [Halorubrum ezzemoulense]MDB9258672.1 hypothetical protein [Halorubrum ezzemoulense]MDB9264470.1 hypothetical protein [Halorubrum ezzemoulense]MDB9269033.1 hypothetical protein [Halorubrum ezzemoulense]MDB9271438.1 hypothetical protein [Halorubrum ezzemoulense]